MRFLDNIGFNKLREISFLKKAENKQDNPQKQQNSQHNIFKTPQKDTFEPSSKRLNDLDTNIINKNLFKFLPNDSLRLEIQLQIAEDRKKDVNTEMKVLSFLGVDENSEKYIALKEKEKKIAEEIERHRQEYRNLGVMYKVIDSVSDVVQKSKNKASQTQVAFMGNSVVKGIKNFFPTLRQKSTINQELNSSRILERSMSNMLSTIVIPYGEKEQRLQKLAEVMAKINGWDAKIAKILKSTEKPGLKISDFFKSGYNKTIEIAKSIKNKVANALPHKKEKEQENFFATSLHKTYPTDLNS